MTAQNASLISGAYRFIAIFSPKELFPVKQPEKGPKRHGAGGQVFAADNPEALKTVFNHIDRMQPVELKPAVPHRIDAFGPFAVAGLILVGLLEMALFGLRYTPW